MNAPSFSLRPARLDDVSALASLIAASARSLGRADYSEAQVEAALEGTWGVDTELIRDGTYFTAEAAGEIVGCGGWSRRQTLFGGDTHADRSSALLDPARDAARIRAFFVRPDWARRGIGRALLERCEAEARAHGFRRLELMATAPGERLYSAFGFVVTRRLEHTMRPGIVLELIAMAKTLYKRE
jgi:GNAT superfamily N-acetyltransferase